MNGVPWQWMTERRRALGMSQRELAEGLMSPALLCQIERGWRIPSTAALERIAPRLQVSVSDLVEAWAPWRNQAARRQTLWEAANDDHTPVLLGVDVPDPVLTPFESHVYRALGEALSGNVALADDLLTRAWRGTVRHELLVRRGPQDALLLEVLQGAHSGAWSRTDRRRALAAEAKARCCIQRLIQRHAAASYWWERYLARRAAVHDRMERA